MRRQTWIYRLEKQLPGWKVWYAGTGGLPGTSGWYAAPVPQHSLLDDARRSLYKIGPYPTPQALRADARERYGADDICQTCNDRWQLCGHRQDETPER